MEINKVAQTIKIIAIITGIIGIIFGFYAIDKLNMNGGFIIIIGGSIVSAVFIFAIGEIVQLLQNIDNNTKNSNNISKNEIPKI